MSEHIDHGAAKALGSSMPGQLKASALPPMLARMTDATSQHVFISYVREDAEAVDELCRMLSAAGIPYWRDLTRLAPGDEWKAKIREAIRSDDAVAFLACFSAQYAARPKNTMNEELTLAVEEFRKHTPGHAWLFPLRLDSTPVPEWEIGANHTIRDLHWTDLFGTDKNQHYVGLTSRLHQLMGSSSPTSANLQAALENLSEAERTTRLSEETKAMLLDPQRKIALSDLIHAETSRIFEELNDPERYHSVPEEVDPLVRATEQARHLSELVQPFCSSLIVATRFGDSTQLEPWISGMRTLTQAAVSRVDGLTTLTALRHIPAVLSIMTAAITAVAHEKYANLQALVISPKIQDPRAGERVALLTATDPWWPFSAACSEQISQMVARQARGDAEPTQTLTDIETRRYSRLKNAAAEWLYATLRPLFTDTLPDEDAFSNHFEHAEVLLQALSLDADPAFRDGHQRYGRPNWTGRAAVYAEYRVRGTNAAQQLAQEATLEGSGWNLVRQGLFAGDLARARQAVQAGVEHFTQVAEAHSRR
ncbi:toll/interleukin-1 receptor domain-containing protein [Micrococcus yunnanensis]|uniref:TIR domain-containing protein n=1 Tax=Micrococcus yunnanensis TaxID=566027 RepID=A0ABR6D3D7_9MICC|nr:toll/interleukin-1 receptor domain-containing protein [Micrococcus yunnanensis]MBA9060626.1 hypothetical protein [Micrococcus yunnanensis]MCV7493551.1 toll/interleukin-1 receptor domain-containing protein [Micrococcus luteus]TFE80617.1 toll/interleukin-1 receptor domain-containing protein [Micrococcus yunnanensis]